MACKTDGLSDGARKVLAAMSSGDGPWGSKEIAQVADMESKQVSCQISSLKKKGLVDSPARCKYVITDEGRAALNS